MSLTLYKCADDRRTITKTLTNSVQIGTIVIKKPTTIISPEILINNFSGVLEYNYCYISEFNRYYFIENIAVLTGQMVELKCEIDVLYTYASYIGGLKGIATRNENAGFTEITDVKVPIRKNKEVKVYEFEGGDFNIDTALPSSFNFVLNIMGGGANGNS